MNGDGSGVCGACVSEGLSADFLRLFPNLPGAKGRVLSPA